MHSSHGSRFFSFSLIVGLLAASSCGQLDPKKDANKTLLPGRDVGCYDKLGERVTRYFSGQIETAEWEDTFDCVNDQLTFFKKYVRGNVSGGYNRADIAALVRQFLIVKRPVSDQFIASIFDIKASIFGGSENVITTAQIDQFLRLSEVLRKETVALLPALQARKHTPSSENLLQLSDGVSIFGTRVGNFLGSMNGTHPVPKESFLPFVRELLIMHGGDGALVDKYGDFVRNFKVVVAGGNADVIEAATWPSIIREGFSLGGVLFAMRDMEKISFASSEDRDFFNLEIVKRTQGIMNRVIAMHGDGIPLELFDPVIDTLPWDELNPAKRAALKKDLRPIVFKLLKSGVPNWLTPAAIRTGVSLYESGIRSQIHLKRIYRSLPPDALSKDFESAARKYLYSVSAGREQEEVNRLIEVSKTYVGLFAEGSAEMEFTNSRRETRTQNHMIRMSWSKLAIQYAFSIYAKGPEVSPGVRSARTEDLVELTSDFIHILREWKLAHPQLTPMEMATKRFREGNLFMPTSNGDAFLDPVETTYYVAFLFSSSAFSGRIFNAITQNHPNWSACPIVGYDELGQEAVEAKCFREIYFSNPQIFWNNFPGLQVAYAKMTFAEKAALARAMEIASRKGGYSENPVGPFDTDSFAALPHYVEDMLERFDVNDNEQLDKREVLDLAYPIFKGTLSRAAKNKKSNVLLKGILTYIIRYGVAPNATQLLLWCARLPFTDVAADRNALYNVVALLSSPIDLSMNKTGSSWPVLDGDLFPSVIPQH